METGLPLPLGGNAIRRELDRDTTLKCCDILQESIRYGLEHRREGMEHALRYARGMDMSRADKFVGMYVNGYTLELGKQGLLSKIPSTDDPNRYLVNRWTNARTGALDQVHG